MDYESLQDLYLHELKDLYGVEKQIYRALPKVIKHASSPQLKQALEHHREQTKTQSERLDRIFERMGKSTRGSRCKAMDGMVEECEDWMDQEAQPEVMDSGLIAQMQRVEHYEMAAYGCARTYAQVLGLKEDEKLLDQTLHEEAETDKKLTSLAEKINAEAAAPAHAEHPA
ncbi:MAG: ferritin-like domain-containing protein [Verrucomicrobiota bacterium]